MTKYTLEMIQHMAAIQTPLPAAYYDAEEVAAALEQAAQDALSKARVWHHPESSSYYLGAEDDNPDHLSVDLGTIGEALAQARREERLRVWRVVLSRLDSGKPHQLYNRAEIESIVAQAVSAASLLSAPAGDREEGKAERERRHARWVERRYWRDVLPAVERADRAEAEAESLRGHCDAWIGACGDAGKRIEALEGCLREVRDELVSLQPHIAQLLKHEQPFIDAHVDKASGIIRAAPSEPGESAGEKEETK